MSVHGPMPRSAWIFPALAVLLFAGASMLGVTFTPSAAGLAFAAVLLAILFGTVFAAVHHAEVIAERIGEPYGTLLLTLAVTVIEVALIATIMLGDKPVPTLARDTVFAVVMIVCNGLVGICILAGGQRTPSGPCGNLDTPRNSPASWAGFPTSPYRCRSSASWPAACVTASRMFRSPDRASISAS